MKCLLALALLVSASSPAIAAAGDTLVFSRDERPADGDLKELTLVEIEGGFFTATFHRAWVDMVKGQPGEETTVLGDKLQCRIRATSVRCLQDERPVDGALVDLNLKAGRGDEYTATLRYAYVDMTTGQNHDQTSVIAKGLTRQLSN